MIGSPRHEHAVAPAVSIPTLQAVLAGVLGALFLVSLAQGSDGARPLGLTTLGSDAASAVLAVAAGLALTLAILIGLQRARTAAGIGLAVLATVAAVGALVGWARDAPAACGCVAGTQPDSTVAHLVADGFLVACAVVAWLAVARQRTETGRLSKPRTVDVDDTTT